MSSIDRTPPPPRSHPSQVELAQWLRGDLSDSEATTVEAHLEKCDSCAQRLDSIETPPDRFLQRLRTSAVGIESGELPPAADANLYFGAIAVQAGLITAQQLADASVLLMSRGGGTMADLLVDQNWIDEAARSSVMALLAARGVKAQRRPAAETLSGRDLTGLSLTDTHEVPRSPSSRLQLKQLHSQGGIGQVWRAYDTVLGREVALKELLPELRGSKTHRERFYREARVAAQLAHPGTAPVYEYREENGRYYYTMKFFSGRTLTEVVRDTHSAAEGGGKGTVFDRLFPLLEHFLVVCDAIAYAHAKGIVHRDLKGENVVLGEFGEVTVIDWGLAKSISQAEGRVTVAEKAGSETPTLEGERLGTPGYMAPEQARGELSAIDEQTDVYGLAAVLYEVLTTRPPFSGATANEVMHRVETADPAAPTLSHPETPPELEAICLRGLSKLKEDRHASAAELRDEVRHWLTDRIQSLRESARQAKFFALSHDLFVALDHRGSIKQVNPAYSHYFGYKPEHSTGKQYTDSIHPDDLDRAKQMFDRVQKGLSQRDTVVRIRSASGEYRAVSWTLTRVPGEPIIFAVGRPQDDASVRRRLDDERARFFALSRDLCVAIDADGKATQVNQAWIDLFGFPAERAIGADVLNHVHPDDRPRTKKLLHAVRQGDSAQDLVIQQQTIDGSYTTVNWTLTRIAGEETLCAVGRQLDKKSERRRAMEARSQFFSLSPDLFVVSDQQGCAAQINEAWHRLLGWSEEELIGKPFSSVVHPDDMEAATRAGRRALVRGAIVDLPIRVRQRDGGYRHVAWTLCRVPGDRVNYALGRDITQSKRAEERLRAILDAGPEALTVVGSKGEIEFANRVLCRLFGYERAELEGQQIEVLMPEEFRERHRQVYADYMKSPSVRSMGRGAKFPAVRRDGERFFVQISLSPLHLNGGSLSILAAIQPFYEP